MTTLLDLFISQKNFFATKSIEQIISIAGDGNLRDGNETSNQLREFLSNIPADNIRKYIEECLTPFQQSGLVLQDLVSEIGKRLGFAVEPGYYRGGSSRIGFDCIWRARDGYTFVVEVKTTDAFQLNLDTLAEYRRRLINEGKIEQSKSSIVLVVGRKDTGGLEAQTRGSRHAWDIRLISVDALLRLMQVKEDLTDTATVTQIQEILKPLEYTRVDRLIDIIFTTSKDLQTEDLAEESEAADNDTGERKRIPAIPAKYHEQCIDRISASLKVPLVKQGRCTYANADQSVRVLCIVSKEYQRGTAIRYWYAFHPSHKEFLDEGKQSFIALGCGTADLIVLIPSSEFQRHLSKMRTTKSDNKFYWHVEIFKKGDKFLLNRPTNEGIDVTRYLIPVA